MTTTTADVVVPCSGRKCPARLALTYDEIRDIADRGDSVRCPGCERKRKEGTRKEAARTRTAADVVLLAAADLGAAGSAEFSEWDLAVAAWSLDRKRFGMKGYEDSYPDHKRLYAELVKMARWVRPPVEKVRPNVYRLTPLGREAADRMRRMGAVA